MSDVMRVHIGSEEWTLGDFVDAFGSYRERAEKAEEAVDHCNREMNNALAQVDHLKARAEKAEQDLAVERQLSSQLLKTSDNRAVLLEKAERERDEAKATLETYRSVADVAERTAEELREQLGSRPWAEDEECAEIAESLSLDGMDIRRVP
jgi:chromosome segregation ATPase